MRNILRYFQEYFKIYQTSVHSVSQSNSVDEMQSATNHYAVKITAEELFGPGDGTVTKLLTRGRT